MKWTFGCFLMACFFSVAVHAQSLRFYGHGGSAGENFVVPDHVQVDRTPTSTRELRLAPGGCCRCGIDRG